LQAAHQAGGGGGASAAAATAGGAHEEKKEGKKEKKDKSGAGVLEALDRGIAVLYMCVCIVFLVTYACRRRIYIYNIYIGVGQRNSGAIHIFIFIHIFIAHIIYIAIYILYVLQPRNDELSLGWYYILDVPGFELNGSIFNFFTRVDLTTL
jgi:hypothetical protein